MNLTLAQKIQVFLLIHIIKAIKLVDDLTTPVFSKFLFASIKLTVLLISLAFLSFLVFSYKTSYIKNIAIGLLATQQNSLSVKSNVLGARTKKEEFPVQTTRIELPLITAQAILVVDKNNKKILYEKNSKTRYASASTTKLMTALVALDIYKLDDSLNIPTPCTELESTKADLPKDAAFKVESLLNAMLISSAGDAACALAIGKVDQTEFVYRMNQKAYQLGMFSSYFTNPIGFDGRNSSHFSTAHDLYKLAETAMKHPTIKSIVSKREYNVVSTDEKFSGKIETTNQLLREIPNSIGVKTGTTAEAGQVLIYEYNDSEKNLLIVVMGSTDRFNDVKLILNWLTASFKWS